ncbi:MAG: hypothetical protein GXO25_04155 [Euryarchaeota archaeon]|nr:hypothetical protein [Euryarchaeota archaeon]
MTIEHVFFKDEGFGYEIEGEFSEIYEIAEKKELRVGNDLYVPGQKYNLRGFFDRDVQYVGVNKERPHLSIWYLGKEKTLFGYKHYFLEIFIVTPYRIFVSYGPGSGRDFNYKGGVWK